MSLSCVGSWRTGLCFASASLSIGRKVGATVGPVRAVAALNRLENCVVFAES